MIEDAFNSSVALSVWSANTLQRRGIDEVARWRMLEYWMQVELYRAVQDGDAGAWRHVGDFEHPYYTEHPARGSKLKTKYIDLVLAEPCPSAPARVVWVELKDLGRSHTTLSTNAKGLGHDLAALWALSPSRTKELWLSPLPHTIDRGRFEEWRQFGPGIASGQHLIAQITLCHKGLLSNVADVEVKSQWLDAFQYRSGSGDWGGAYEIATAETEQFVVFALVTSLQHDD